ncbi:MAG: hypothetical protein FH748_04495 [Balneolaceae bacterium]|nr:hypothetical protein [Balneolaceae bacterium]
MKKFAYTFPIPKNNIDEWLQFAEEVKTSKRKEFSAMHARIGVTKESWHLQDTEDGYLVVVYTEADDEQFLERFKNDNSEFSDWFREKVSDLQNVDLNESTVMSEMVLDWEE